MYCALKFFKFVNSVVVCCCCYIQSCLTLWDPIDYSPPGCSVHWISQARILEWVAISFSRGSSRPRDRAHISCLAGRSFTTEPQSKGIDLTLNIFTSDIQRDTRKLLEVTGMSATLIVMMVSCVYAYVQTYQVVYVYVYVYVYMYLCM